MPSRAQGGRPVRAVIDAVTTRLTAAGVPTPRFDAEVLVRHVTGWSRSRLVLGAEELMPTAAASELERLVDRRERREPLQLIVGSVGFRYLDLEVRKGVFIPRPETELLAGEAIARVPAAGTVVEPCTGTGAVACSVALESEAELVVATDVSPAAVALAVRNMRRAGVEIVVAEGDLFEPVAADLRGRIDVIVSNPPYLAQHELSACEPEVAVWDPVGALVAGPTGHEISDRLLAHAPDWLTSSGWLLLEVDAGRAAETARRALAAGFDSAEVLADLAGTDRIVAARL